MEGHNHARLLSLGTPPDAAGGSMPGLLSCPSIHWVMARALMSAACVGRGCLRRRPGASAAGAGPLLKAAAQAADRYEAEPPGMWPVRSLRRCSRARSPHALTPRSPRAHERRLRAQPGGRPVHTVHRPGLAAHTIGDTADGRPAGQSVPWQYATSPPYPEPISPYLLPILADVLSSDAGIQTRAPEVPPAARRAGSLSCGLRHAATDRSSAARHSW